MCTLLRCLGAGCPVSNTSTFNLPPGLYSREKRMTSMCRRRAGLHNILPNPGTSNWCIKVVMNGIFVRGMVFHNMLVELLKSQ